MPVDNTNSPNWLDKLIEGGIPQLLVGPAGKAISRLVGATVDIPVAKLEQISRGIRDETKAKSLVMDTLAEKSAELGLSDPRLLERGLNNMIGKAYREQHNREEVARKAVEYLEHAPVPETNDGPSDDWMDIFEDYASKASSDSIRDMFARVLAGEIRKPGEFSRATLHFVAIMDVTIARLIERIAPYVVDNNFIPKELISNEINYGEWLALQEAGFITFSAGNLSLTQWPNSDNLIYYRMGKNVVRFEAKNSTEFKIPSVKLTSPAQQILSTLDTKYKIHEMAKLLWVYEPKTIQVGELHQEPDGQMFARNMVFVQEPIS